MKVLFHIDEEEKWNLTLNNVKNMMAGEKEVGEKFIIEVVANSIAVKMLQNTGGVDNIFSMELQNLSENGVEFVACNNALNKYQIGHNDLYPFIKVVPAGVIEIAKKQNEGYAYIKP